MNKFRIATNGECFRIEMRYTKGKKDEWMSMDDIFYSDIAAAQKVLEAKEKQWKRMNEDKWEPVKLAKDTDNNNSKLIEGKIYLDSTTNEEVEFCYMGKTGLAIVCEPGDRGGGMQSSWAVSPKDLILQKAKCVRITLLMTILLLGFGMTLIQL